MARVRELVRLCLARTCAGRGHYEEEDPEVILLHTLQSNENKHLYLDENGKMIMDGHLVTVAGQCINNKQLYFQVVKSKKVNDSCITVKIQASLVPSSYNLKTLSDLTCGNLYCCNQLFVNSLYQTNLQFIFKTENKMLQLVAHKHGQYGILYFYFDLVDK